MIRFYSPNIVEEQILPPEESLHCVKVLRHKENDIIEAIDGKGYIYKCKIWDADPRCTKLEIIETTPWIKPWKGEIAIGIAPPKNPERLDWVIEKITEIGVDEIIPVVCQRSERKNLKPERLERLIVAAMKQSLKAKKPILTALSPFNELILKYNSWPQKFIAYCDEAKGKDYLCKIMRPGMDCIIIIGPEGDFSKSEVELAISNGYIPVSLGECRLRTETAALTAVNTFHVIGGLNS